MNDLFLGFEFIRSYIDGILILTRVEWVDHVHKLKINSKSIEGKWT